MVNRIDTFENVVAATLVILCNECHHYCLEALLQFVTRIIHAICILYHLLRLQFASLGMQYIRLGIEPRSDLLSGYTHLSILLNFLHYRNMTGERDFIWLRRHVLDGLGLWQNREDMGTWTTGVCLKMTRWRHQMEAISALLALCAENSAVPGEFPAQRPVARNFDVFFDLRLNKRSSKQSRDWWFETPSFSLWRHCHE